MPTSTRSVGRRAGTSTATGSATAATGTSTATASATSWTRTSTATGAANDYDHDIDADGVDNAFDADSDASGDRLEATAATAPVPPGFIGLISDDAFWGTDADPSRQRTMARDRRHWRARPACLRSTGRSSSRGPGATTSRSTTAT